MAKLLKYNESDIKFEILLHFSSCSHFSIEFISIEQETVLHMLETDFNQE
jgi:hypothetical protein